MKHRTHGPKVSILVPVYNTSQFLPECLESLIHQSIKDIQIICINDGSTDNSGQILKHYASIDRRIEIIEKENSGYGASMNRGLDAARGEYIGIVESDDFASRNMFKTYYSFAKRHNLDLVKSNYFEHDNSGDRPIRVFDSFKYKRVFSPIDMIEAIKVLPIIWSALYRREMIVSEQIRFTETPGASFQDTSFVQRVWFSAQRVALLPGCYLHYRVDNSNSSVQSENKVFEVCTEYATSKDFLRKDPSRYATFAPVLERMKLDTYRWNYNRIAVSRRLDFLKRWTEEVRQARDEGTLLKEQFDDYNWGIIQELLEGPEPFFEKHRDTL